MISTNEIGTLLLVLCAGLLLGIFFFGGLWWSTKKAVGSKSPFLWFFGSLVIRLGVTLVTIFFVAGSHWERILICLLGFVIARKITTSYLRPSKLEDTTDKEINYENES